MPVVVVEGRGVHEVHSFFIENQLLKEVGLLMLEGKTPPATLCRDVRSFPGATSVVQIPDPG